MICLLGGLTKDVCNCCDVCSKVKGEKCGGPWNIKGRCDKFLTCKQSHGGFNAIGRCGKSFCHKNFSSNCCVQIKKENNSKFVNSIDFYVYESIFSLFA